VNLEEIITSLREKGDQREAAARAVEGYGPEIFGFLVTMLRDEHNASEVFSQACEDLWQGIGQFEGRCAMRTWFYAIARHAMARFRRSPQHRPGRHVSLSEASDAAERVRSRTMPHLRTSVKSRFAAIRDSLDEDDRALLILRIDRDLSWREIARIFSADDNSDETLRRIEARLRQRFHLVKGKIRERARQSGLLRDDER
jgi:RNA polymerase sigma-70 factor (ECF subfamily)